MDMCVRVTAALLACALGLCTCGDNEHVDDYGGVVDLTSQYDGGVAPQFLPRTGYVNGQKMEYYDFGQARVERNNKNVVIGAPTAYMDWFYDRDSYDRTAMKGQPLFQLKLDTSGKPLLDDSSLANLDDPDNPCLGSVTNGGPAPTTECDPPRLQHPIADTIPGRPDYTPFWEVAHVLVPKGYPLDSIKSRQTLVDAG